MGCRVTKRQIQIEQLPPWKCKTLYVFTTADEKNPQILRFDGFNEEWEAFRMPKGVNVAPDSKAVLVDEDLILITGGRIIRKEKVPNNEAGEEAEAACLLFSIKNMVFFQFPPLNMGRYKHMVAAFHNSAFVLGGLTDELGVDGSITSSVEKISMIPFKEALNLNPNWMGKAENETLRTNLMDVGSKWAEVEPFMKMRYNANIFIYQNEIYIMGGQMRGNKICRHIERYNSSNNQWVYLNWKLPFAIHSSSITALNHNELILIGGKNDSGKVPSIFHINLLKRQYKSRRGFSLREDPKILHFNENVYIFGGDDEKSCERFNPIEFISMSSSESYTSIVDNDLIKFPGAKPSVFIGEEVIVEAPANSDYFPESEVIPEVDPSQIYEKNFFFGTQTVPFLLEYNSTQDDFVYHSVSLDFKFYTKARAKRLNKNFILSVGGTTVPHKKASKSCQLLYLENKNCKKLSKLIEGRLNFDVCFLNEFIYVIGGTTFVKGVETALGSCEILNLKNSVWIWKGISPLNVARYHHKTYVYQGKIYVFGGCDGVQVFDSIESYDPASDKWTIMPTKLEIPMFLFSSIQLDEKQILIVGGKSKLKKILEASVYLIDTRVIKKGATMKEDRSQPKLIRKGEFLLVFGGLEKEGGNLFEILNLNTMSHIEDKFQNFQKNIGKYFRDKKLEEIQYC